MKLTDTPPLSANVLNAYFLEISEKLFKKTGYTIIYPYTFINGTEFDPNMLYDNLDAIIKCLRNS